MPEVLIGVALSVHLVFSPRGSTVWARRTQPPVAGRSRARATERSRSGRLNGLCRYPTAPALSASAFWASPTTHHENSRLHAKVADVFQQVETLLPAVAYPWNDQVEQNEIERCPQQDVERLGIGIRRYDVVGVPVPKAGKNSSNTPTTFGSSSTMS